MNPPPWMSAGRSLPAWPRLTTSSRRAAISARPSVSARWMTGTTRPSSMATARPMLISACRTIAPSFHEAFTPGCRDEGRRDELHQQVRVGDPGAGLLARPLAPRDQAAHVDLAEEIEVGRGGPARRHALGHDPPDGADAWRLAAGRGAPRRHARPRPGADGQDVGREHGAARAPSRGAPATSRPRSAASRRAFGDAAMSRDRRARRTRPGLPALDVGEDVGLLDLAAGRRHLREIDAVLAGDLRGRAATP